MPFPIKREGLFIPPPFQQNLAKAIKRLDMHANTQNEMFLTKGIILPDIIAGGRMIILTIIFICCEKFNIVMV